MVGLDRDFWQKPGLRNPEAGSRTQKTRNFPTGPITLLKTGLPRYSMPHLRRQMIGLPVKLLRKGFGFSGWITPAEDIFFSIKKIWVVWWVLKNFFLIVYRQAKARCIAIFKSKHFRESNILFEIFFTLIQVISDHWFWLEIRCGNVVPAISGTKPQKT